MEKNYDIIIFWNQQKILHIHLKNAKYSAPLIQLIQFSEVKGGFWKIIKAVLIE